MQRSSKPKGMSHSQGGSSGSFSASSSHGFSGSSGAFPSQSSFFNRNDYSDHGDGFIYPIARPPWTYEQSSTPQQSSTMKRRSAVCCHVVPSVFAFFGSFWLFFGLYGTQNLELGLNYSRLFEANSLFVKEIQVRNSDGVQGPSFYSFSTHPPLNKVRKWSKTYDVNVEGLHHQEWAFWLNRGSKVKLEYSIGDPVSYVVIAMLEGEGNFNEWLKDPRDSRPTVSWHSVHGKGYLNFEVDKNNDYYFALGNLHDQRVEMRIQFHVDAKLYNTAAAYFQCTFSSDTCRKKVSLLGSSFAVLTAPESPLDGVDVWHVKVVYGARWSTYIFSVGLVCLVSAVLFVRRKEIYKKRDDAEVAPLIAGATASHLPGDHITAISSSIEAFEASAPIEPHMHSASSAQPFDNGKISEEQLCAVCLDAKKDSFFDPCGHCATCYSCGLRIVEDGRSICPICRQKVEKVRKLYDS